MQVALVHLSLLHLQRTTIIWSAKRSNRWHFYMAISGTCICIFRGRRWLTFGWRKPKRTHDMCNIVSSARVIGHQNDRLLEKTEKRQISSLSPHPSWSCQSEKEVYTRNLRGKTPRVMDHLKWLLYVRLKKLVAPCNQQALFPCLPVGTTNSREVALAAPAEHQTVDPKTTKQHPRQNAVFCRKQESWVCFVCSFSENLASFQSWNISLQNSCVLQI